jgi:hypothetical protein
MRQPTKEFALCIDNADYEASLIRAKVYRILRDPKAAKDDLLVGADPQPRASRSRPLQKIDAVVYEGVKKALAKRLSHVLTSPTGPIFHEVGILST